MLCHRHLFSILSLKHVLYKFSFFSRTWYLPVVNPMVLAHRVWVCLLALTCLYSVKVEEL